MTKSGEQFAFLTPNSGRLYEALMQKQGTVFWKCWNAKCRKDRSDITIIDGASDVTRRPASADWTARAANFRQDLEAT